MTAQDNEKTITSLKHAIFKLNGLFLEEAELVLSEIGLTTSRARVLGTLLRGNNAMTIPQISYEMGQTRQTTGRLVNLMQKDGFLEKKTNPIHTRSKFICVTASGKKVYAMAFERHLAVNDYWPKGIKKSDLNQTIKLIDTFIETLHQRIENGYNT